ncbi:hypothetical protein G6F68_011941 [Rhizopus microsporus]|nr:hypothetical protein G6F68_011941 [Rhizopus microsporus]
MRSRRPRRRRPRRLPRRRHLRRRRQGRPRCPGLAGKRRRLLGAQEGCRLLHPAGPAEDHHRQRGSQAEAQGHQPVHQGRAVVRCQAGHHQAEGASAEEAEGRRAVSARPNADSDGTALAVPFFCPAPRPQHSVAGSREIRAQARRH